MSVYVLFETNSRGYKNKITENELIFGFILAVPD